LTKLKRLLAPKFWRIPKKKFKWTVAPRPGPHKKFECIPLQILVRDILQLVEKGKEARSIIKKGEVLVDGKPRKDPKYPAGLMDVIEIPKINKAYRIIPTSIGLDVLEIPKDEAKLKLCKINNKKILKGNKIQLNLHDGRNVIVEKDEYKTGDSILIELPDQKIVDHVKMEKGSIALITKGKNMGKLVEIKDIITTRSREPNKVICKAGDEEITAIKDYVFVVGKEKPLIVVS
jgi:small subunit ribosomal protein S4e